MPDQPTQIGLISDVHGNAVALQAVLEEMPPVDTLVCAGDIVGYGPSPKACLETIREEALATVEGNHDRAVVMGRPYESGDRYALETLAEPDFSWLESLPRKQLVCDDQLKVVHDHPDERDRYTYPEDFGEHLLGSEDVLVLGHTHVQHAETFDEGIVVNPGSVGQPRDGNPDAGFAVIDLTELSVDLHRVTYEREKVAERIQSTSISDHNAQRLHQGK